MRVILLKSVIILFSVMAFSVEAKDLDWPTKGYSGDEILQTKEGTFETKIYYQPKPRKIRREINLEKIDMGTTINIVNFKKKEVIVLMPKLKMHIKQPFGSKDEGAPITMDTMKELSSEAQGTEQVNGSEATRYKVTLKDPEGVVFNGFMWKVSNNIVVKTDIKAKNGMFLKQSLTNLSIGDQPADLFKVPDEYKNNKFNMGELMKNF
ncbi:MAG: hypothetical protein OEY19_01590 [Gammaproteobacteria bacterium]|nr:hypothetical protein [Gammaproteobacteria bacterium]MDH5629169.1 hypothetical protein [Gammaproteobacteria bacterium]